MAEIQLKNSELQMLLNNKEAGFKYKERREENWRENYELYRDHVTINRLTQRQSVNMPLMKTTVKTVLKDIDDMPVIVFENLDNDKEAEVFQNEHWKWTLERNNAEIQDIVDKKQNIFFGRTFDVWQVEEGEITFDIVDPEDILVDRFMNPYDIDSARYLIHTHIFVPLSSLKQNPDYDQEEVKRLEDYFETEQGIIKAEDNENTLMKKNEKMSNLGVSDVEDPVLGETYVELTMHRVFRSGEKVNGKVMPDQIFHYVEAENMCILMKKAQEEIIGSTKDHFWRNHYNYNTWGDDLDKQDFWTDGIADIVREPNKLLNAWYSQMVENRTLRNFGMHYYDTSMAELGFDPSSFNPVPWGWYGVPGKPADFMQKVDIPDLSESLDEMAYVTQMLEKATGATATQQGAMTANQRTLGEVQMAQNEAKARTQGISKFYTAAWKQRAHKYLKLVEAASDKINSVKIYKKGKNSNNIFAREISPNDWMTKSGYQVRVWSQEDKKAKDMESIQNLQAMKLAMPDNPKVNEVYVRKLAEFNDLTPEEVTEIMDYEKKKMMPMLPDMNTPVGNVPTPQPMPVAPVAPPTPAPAPKKPAKKKSSGAVKKLKNIRNQVSKMAYA
jgi:hypothetical protein